MEKKNIFNVPVFVVSLIIGCIATCLITYSQYVDKHNVASLLIRQQANEMSSSVNDALNEVYSLEALIIGSNGKNIDLNQIGPSIIHKSNIKNILLAPNGTVTSVYPTDESQLFLGLNLYSVNNEVYKDTKQARDTGKLIITEPYTFKDNQKVISGQLKVSIPQSNGTKKDWGIVSVCIPFPDAININNSVLDKHNYTYKVYFENSNTDSYEELFGKDFKLQSGYESYSFSIHNIHLKISAYPDSGWFNILNLFIFLVIILIFAVIFAFCTSFVMNQTKSLKEIATIDALTKLYNKYSGTITVNELLNSSNYTKGAFFLLDIDNFKEVNNTLGHQTGDKVLIEVANILRATCRNDDIVCRLQKDEFAIYMPFSKSTIFINDKAEQILALMDRNVSNENQELHINSSIGISIFPEHGRTFDRLYRNADIALCDAKKAGKNRISFYER